MRKSESINVLLYTIYPFEKDSEWERYNSMNDSLPVILNLKVFMSEKSRL